MGYGRLEGQASTETLARLYAAARVHVNLFQPSFKLREKLRVGAKVTKRWHPPATPADRALASGRLDAESAARIQELRARADPVIALAAIRAAQVDLGQRVDQRGAAAASGETPVVVDLATGVSHAQKNGERRTIHRRPYRRVKPIPKRPSMLDPHRTEIEAWLEAQPDMTAVVVLARLRQRHPDRLADLHLRTVQRAVKVWREQQAKRVVRCGTEVLGAVPTIAPRPSPWAHGDGRGEGAPGNIPR